MIATYRILGNVNDKEIDIVMCCQTTLSNKKVRRMVEAMYPKAKKIENLRFKKH